MLNIDEVVDPELQDRLWYQMISLLAHEHGVVISVSTVKKLCVQVRGDM